MARQRGDDAFFFDSLARTRHLNNSRAKLEVNRREKAARPPIINGLGTARMRRPASADGYIDVLVSRLSLIPCHNLILLVHTQRLVGVVMQNEDDPSQSKRLTLSVNARSLRAGPSEVSRLERPWHHVDVPAQTTTVQTTLQPHQQWRHQLEEADPPRPGTMLTPTTKNPAGSSTGGKMAPPPLTLFHPSRSPQRGDRKKTALSLQPDVATPLVATTIDGGGM